VLKGFYDGIAGSYPAKIAQNGHEIKYYLLPGPGKPNYPFEIDFFNLFTAPTGTTLPTEVALCLSFQGLKAAGAPQARRRGRVYIGPLDEATNTDGRPSTTVISAIVTAATTLSSAVTALGAGYEWGIWSVTDQHFVPAIDGWVDNSWDTQRRRGVDPNSRTTFLIT
jgi:hypothetical protein